MRIDALLAERTLVAPDVDLPHHPLTDPFSLVTGDHRANELVSQHSPESVVASQNLQVSGTDTCQSHPNERVLGTRGRSGILGNQVKPLIQD
jgi:hypothetical protein